MTSKKKDSWKTTACAFGPNVKHDLWRGDTCGFHSAPISLSSAKWTPVFPRAPWLSGVISEANVPPGEGDQSGSLNSPGDVMWEPNQVVQVWMEGKGYLQANLNRTWWLVGRKDGWDGHRSRKGSKSSALQMSMVMKRLLWPNITTTLRDLGYYH